MEKFSGLDSPWHRTLRTGHRYKVFEQGKLLQPSCKQGTSRQSRQWHITHGWMGLSCRGWNPDPAWHLIQLSFCRMLGKYRVVTNTAVNKNTLKIRKTYKSIDITLKTCVFWCHSGAMWSVNVEELRAVRISACLMSCSASTEAKHTSNLPSLGSQGLRQMAE